jgi:uroporphyrinogen decarboxylase
MTTAFEPDYRNLVDAAWNRRPRRLPLYEHFINDESIEQITGRSVTGIVSAEKQPGDSPFWSHDQRDWAEYFRRICSFWREMTYDTVSVEVCTTEVCPNAGALLGERPGPIQTRADFQAYPWQEVIETFKRVAKVRFDALRAALPAGMKAVGGVGNGPFETSEDLVGYEKLCYMQFDDPELFADLYVKIGDIQMVMWRWVLDHYDDVFAVARIGDDMGFKTATLLSPQTLIAHVVPQYRRLIAQIHAAGKPYLQHSCGRIFDIMEALIGVGMNAKHSNEDAIAPFDEWIDRYGDRVAFFGGIDTDRLCWMSPEDVFAYTVEHGMRYRAKARGYAMASGNSIPPYVPRACYLAMIRAAQEIRRREETA